MNTRKNKSKKLTLQSLRAKLKQQLTAAIAICAERPRYYACWACQEQDTDSPSSPLRSYFSGVVFPYEDREGVTTAFFSNWMLGGGNYPQGMMRGSLSSENQHMRIIALQLAIEFLPHTTKAQFRDCGYNVR